MSGHDKNSKSRQGKKPLSHGWIVVPSKTYPDRVYFYNTVTKCSTWKNPCEAIDDAEQNTSSEASSSGERKYFKAKPKSQASHYRKKKNKNSLKSPDRNNIIQINSEIEDYDEQQDQYFNNIPNNVFSSSFTHIISPSSSPDSITSSRTNLSDYDQPSNSLLEDNKKQLWVHFNSTLVSPNAKKSVALSDFNEPPKDLKMEATPGSSKKNSVSKDHSEGNGLKSFRESPEKNINKKKKGKTKNHHSKYIKNVSFKRTDKTPAQTRLLKFRKQNLERLKELAVKNPDYAFHNKKHVDNNFKLKSTNNLSLDNQTDDENFSDAYFERIEVCNVVQEGGSQSEFDFSEEMDWEPSSEESDVKNINTFREQSSKASEVSSDIFFGLNSDHSFAPMKTYSWFLVLDTNIFVSCLSFVKELRDTKVPDLGYPVIYVPWRVLQELDHLKDTKIDAVNKHLHINVRKAITFLNNNFKSGHPRVFGQSFEDFANMVDVETSAPDDEILQTCIQFQKMHADKKLMLLTNDKNLESKAIVSRVEVYSKERFYKKFLSSRATSPKFSDDLERSTNEAIKVDDYICEVQAVLKDFLTLFVETEMKIAFQGDWIKVAFKKPPWTLEDTLQCLLKHWMSVFFLYFTKEARSDAEKLQEGLFKRVPASTEDVAQIIQSAQRLVKSIKRSQKKKMPYSDLIPPTLSKLSDLLKAFSPDHSPQTDSGVTSIPSSASANNDSPFQTQEMSQEEVPNSEVSKVKNLFKDIWNSLRSFCCSVSDVINGRNDTDIQEMKIKLFQVLKEVEELVVTVEKIIEIDVSDVSENHPLIIYFSNFLIRVYPAMAPDLMSELPKGLSAFFSDYELRFILTNSLRDFKEFINDLTQAAEYFNTHFPC